MKKYNTNNMYKNPFDNDFTRWQAKRDRKKHYKKYWSLVRAIFFYGLLIIGSLLFI